MGGDSKVGTNAIYQDDDQRNKTEEPPKRFEEGAPSSHKALDSKDERSIANRLAAAEQKTEPADDKETSLSKTDPTLPAKLHGNKPSKGAEIDAELKADDEEYLKSKGKA